MPFAPEQLEAELRLLLTERLKPRGYRGFDEKIGKGGSGWTSKFLRGGRSLTLDTLLVVCDALNVHPSEVMSRAYPQEASPESAIAEYVALGEEDVRRIVVEELSKAQLARR